MAASNEQMRKQSRQMGLTFAAVLVAAVILFSGGAFLFTRAFTGHIATAVDYKTMTLASASYSDKIDVSGTIQSAVSVAVTPEVDGVVESVSVKDGAKVAKGDVLFTMKNDTVKDAATAASKEYDGAKSARNDAQKQADKANAALSKAIKSLEKANKSLAAAEKKNAAAEEAGEDPESQEEDADSKAEKPDAVDLAPYKEAVAIAKTGVENAQDAYDTAKENLDAAAENAGKAKVEDKKARAQLDKLTVKAPNAGTVANMKLEKGQGIVVAALNGGVMNIVDTSALSCIVQVPESQVSNIVKGQSAVVRCEAMGNKELSATVSRIADVPSKAQEEAPAEDGAAMTDPNQANETYYDVTLTLGKAYEGMKVGMSATAEIHVRDFGTVYYVPATAVASNNAGMYVEAVIDATTTKQYSVTQLATADDDQLVIQGVSLSEGMNIRTDLSAGV